ncbi:glycosyltransferase family 2 protein [uncultured Dokdonia sp.]|uniref:glycosyltransferase family 2 protein n=1 Tax=uncultured Dokdonia sp. TaxID=575653 RepID=UPI00261646B6|nr:glycosyltransferase family 2 protein [uncultured Dokdonia sp.]
MDSTILISICTATYNRSELLPILYRSLEAQIITNFEWIVIDDGSTDTTDQVLNELIQNASFPIQYYKQENQGKHIAINTGVSKAKGEFFFIVDSDDRLPSDAIAILSKKVQHIKDHTEIAGVVGLKCYFNKQVVGSSSLERDTICDIFDYRYTHKVKGDRAEVFKTSILKQYPFPKFAEEKFLPESIVWNRIGQHYQMLFFNENVYECEYLADGLSARSILLRRKYPKGVIHLYAELGAIIKIGLVNRCKAYINFWRFFFCDKSSMFHHIQLLKKQYVSFLWIPVGMLFYLKDCLTQKKDI